MKPIDDAGSMVVAYTDIPGTRKGDPDPLLPQYFLTLLNQIGIWLRAFGAGD